MVGVMVGVIEGVGVCVGVSVMVGVTVIVGVTVGVGTSLPPMFPTPGPKSKRVLYLENPRLLNNAIVYSK